MKKTLLTVGLTCVMSLCFLSSCGNSDRKDWDDGYESAWEGEEAPSSFWTSKEQKEGYEAGLQDVWIYNAGYSDGYEGEKPEYFNDHLYMDAYKDGKKDKEKRW